MRGALEPPTRHLLWIANIRFTTFKVPTGFMRVEANITFTIKVIMTLSTGIKDLVVILLTCLSISVTTRISFHY